MRNLSITRVVRISARMTAEDWQLYTSKPGADRVAHALNALLEFHVADGKTKDEIREVMLVVMRGLSDFGAYDTEPCAYLDQLLEEIFK
jgi:predicted TIM-barrel enzyme